VLVASLFVPSASHRENDETCSRGGGTGWAHVLWVHCSAPAVLNDRVRAEHRSAYALPTLNAVSTVACNSGTSVITRQQLRSQLAAAIERARQYPEVWHQFANRTLRYLHRFDNTVIGDLNVQVLTYIPIRRTNAEKIQAQHTIRRLSLPFSARSHSLPLSLRRLMLGLC
jgi:hypothetical protein